MGMDAVYGPPFGVISVLVRPRNKFSWALLGEAWGKNFLKMGHYGWEEKIECLIYT